MPILSDLVAALRPAVDAMTTPTYNFNHPAPDVQDPALWVYPQTFLRVPLATIEDRPGMVGKHQSIWPLTFRTLVPKGVGEITIEAHKVIDDFMKLMATQFPALQALGLLRYDLAGSAWAPRLVAAAPAETKVTFNLWVRQSRANPASP
jgi:hypothetical protein